MLGFLAANDDTAFKAREMARQAERDDGAVSTALTRLKDRGLVEHKGPYWAIMTDERRFESIRYRNGVSDRYGVRVLNGPRRCW